MLGIGTELEAVSEILADKGGAAPDEPEIDVTVMVPWVENAPVPAGRLPFTLVVGKALADVETLADGGRIAPDSPNEDDMNTAPLAVKTPVPEGCHALELAFIEDKLVGADKEKLEANEGVIPPETPVDMTVLVPPDIVDCAIPPKNESVSVIVERFNWRVEFNEMIALDEVETGKLMGGPYPPCPIGKLGTGGAEERVGADVFVVSNDLIVPFWGAAPLS